MAAMVKKATKSVKKPHSVKEAKVEYVATPSSGMVNVSPIVIAPQIAALPAEAQALAAEFVAMLQRHFAEPRLVTELKAAPTDWTKLDAFGIWADRPEMEDSVAYVRELRKSQWSRNRKGQHAAD
jgi:hypothetical protein